MAENNNLERLQKIIAERGYCSRRKAEELIQAGKVKVNNTLVTELGAKFPPDCDIEINGKSLAKPSERAAEFVYLAVNKPIGFICTASDPQSRRLITELAPSRYGRIFPVGRLDINSAGLIFLTNDGAFANLVTHPSSAPDKTYEVKIDAKLTPAEREELTKGVFLSDGLTAPCTIESAENDPSGTTYLLTIHEGKNREVRRMMQYFNKRVISLTRTKIGPIELQHLSKGDFIELSKELVDKMKDDCRQRKKRNEATRSKEKGA